MREGGTTEGRTEVEEWVGGQTDRRGTGPEGEGVERSHIASGKLRHLGTPVPLYLERLGLRNWIVSDSAHLSPLFTGSYLIRWAPLSPAVAFLMLSSHRCRYRFTHRGPPRGLQPRLGGSRLGRGEAGSEGKSRLLAAGHFSIQVSPPGLLASPPSSRSGFILPGASTALPMPSGPATW